MRAKKRTGSSRPLLATNLDDWVAALELPPPAIRVRVVSVAPRAALPPLRVPAALRARTAEDLADPVARRSGR